MTEAEDTSVVVEVTLDAPHPLIPDRPQPCTRRTWCIRLEHPDTEPCHEVARRPIEPSDFGPNASKARRW